MTPTTRSCSRQKQRYDGVPALHFLSFCYDPVFLGCAPEISASPFVFSGSPRLPVSRVASTSPSASTVISPQSGSPSALHARQHTCHTGRSVGVCAVPAIRFDTTHHTRRQPRVQKKKIFHRQFKSEKRRGTGEKVRSREGRRPRLTLANQGEKARNRRANKITQILSPRLSGGPSVSRFGRVAMSS